MSYRGKQPAGSHQGQAQHPTRDSLTQLVQRVGRVVNHEEREFAAEGAQLRCEKFVSLEVSGSFEEWWRRDFNPKVWQRFQREREKKAARVRLDFRIRHTQRVTRTAQPNESGEGSQSGQSGPQSQVVAAVMDPAVEELIEEAYRMELATSDDKYDLLLAHISDKCVMKHTIENEVVDIEAKWPVEDEGPMTGAEKVEHFYDRMKETHPEGLVTTATWSNIEREGIAEPAPAFAQRFEVAAIAAEQPPREMNARFVSLATKVWEREEFLRDEIPRFRLANRLKVQDRKRVHVMDLAKSILEIETFYAQEIAEGFVKAPAATKSSSGGGGGAGRSTQQVGTQEAKDSQLAAQLGLQPKKFPSGEYYPCPRCNMVHGKIQYHHHSKCPVVKQQQSAAGEGSSTKRGGAVMSAAGSAKPQGGRGGGRYGPHGGRGGGAQQETCKNCGNSGHYWRNCPVALKPFLQQVKDGKVPPRAGKGLMAGADEDAASQAPSEALSKADLVEALREVLQSRGHSGSDSPRRGFGGCTMTEAAKSWLQSCVPKEGDIPGGWTHKDAASSDEEAAGYMARLPVMAVDGAVPPRRSTRVAAAPRGQVQPWWAVTRDPEHREQPEQPSARARAQQRMREEHQDELREQRNRLPPGMLNPVDIGDPARIPPVVGEEVAGRDSGTWRMRHEQLVSLLRTCLAHTRFGAMPAELVVDAGPDAMAKWQSAKTLALRGEIDDGRDQRALVWRTAIQRALENWHAQAQLKWADFLQLDFGRIFREAIAAQFGPEAGSIPPDVGLLGEVARTAAMRRWQQDMAYPGRRPVALLDREAAKVTVNGLQLDSTVADTGASKPLLHRRIVDRLNLPLAGGGVHITNVSGSSTVMRSTQEQACIALGSGTPAEVSVMTVFTVMDGPGLPDLLLDNELMAMLGGFVPDPCKWQATYQSMPWLGSSSPLHVVPFRPVSEAMAAAVSRLASQQLQPVSCVEDPDEEGNLPLQESGQVFMVQGIAPHQSANFGFKVGGGAATRKMATIFSPSHWTCHTGMSTQPCLIG